MRVGPCIAAAAAIAWAATPAMADPATPVASEKIRPPADPNQKICEDITVVGSRLGTKRICATRAEWAAKKREDKDEVDRIQRSPCMPGKTDACAPGG